MVLGDGANDATDEPLFSSRTRPAAWAVTIMDVVARRKKAAMARNRAIRYFFVSEFSRAGSGLEGLSAACTSWGNSNSGFIGPLGR